MIFVGLLCGFSLSFVCCGGLFSWFQASGLLLHGLGMAGCLTSRICSSQKARQGTGNLCGRQLFSAFFGGFLGCYSLFASFCVVFSLFSSFIFIL